MRRAWPSSAAAAALASSLALGAAAPAPLDLQITDQAGLPPAQLDGLRREFGETAHSVFAYLHVEHPQPIKLVISRDVNVGLYQEDTLYLPPDEHNEMLETFIHELAHQATGHDSSYFYKEGIATHTVEALYLAKGRIPQGWPQYGQPCDAWIALFRRRGQLPRLQEALDWPRYNGRTPQADYRSWQVYLMGGSFAGWLISVHGYEAFKRAFDGQGLPQPADVLEARWLATIAGAAHADFDPAEALPGGPRYADFARRLGPAHKPLR